ncbi:Uncharacterised protein [Mycobacteroides abscessus subsp. abscessus]|nr:Uncharacterised protein [Mycobacteroides abscessus subsp. abscessus]
MPNCSLAPPDSDSYGTVLPSRVRLRILKSLSISTSKVGPKTMRPNRSSSARNGSTYRSRIPSR